MVRQGTIDLEGLRASKTLQAAGVGDELGADLPQRESQRVKTLVALEQTDGQLAFMLEKQILVESNLKGVCEVSEDDRGVRGEAQNPKPPREQFVVTADRVQLLVELPIHVQVRTNDARHQGGSQGESLLQCKIARIAEPIAKRFQMIGAPCELCHHSPNRLFLRTRPRIAHRVQHLLQQVEPTEAILGE